jgi:uncharacterized lipoprotein YddW (UPF0748 family)
MKKILLTCLLVPVLLTPQNKNPKYEFRGAWVATVANIDWSSKPALPVGKQIIELVQMFDSLEAAGINAVFFQVRTECDALYNSKYEPWSYWLTGKQGKAPEPFYDPLELAVSEAHTRKMELHAWFNPYRAVKKIGAYEADSMHVSVLHPEWILQFKDYKMLDPGNPDARKYVLNVMTDVLENYDVDGIHFDDYFYPYGPKVSNEDSLTFVNYNRGFTDINDWRRDNINQLMREIYQVVNKIKPHVKFGISPFGIVKNEYAGTDGFNSYEILYCDPLTWLDEQIVDYINPQLYWEMDHDKAPYKKLLPWWTTVKNDRHLYIGHFSSKMAAAGYKGSYAELGDQIKMNRANNVEGSVFFSAKSISRNWSGFKDTLTNNYYKYPAFPSTMPWKDSVPPLPPVNVTFTEQNNSVIVNWNTPRTADDGEYPYNYAVYKFSVNEPVDIKNTAKMIHKTINAATIFIDNDHNLETQKFIYVVTSLDRLHNESDFVIAGSVKGK